jgi:hypothetical protein
VQERLQSYGLSYMQVGEVERSRWSSCDRIDLGTGMMVELALCVV